MTDLLRGLRLIELAGVLAGPSAGQFFAELGANVIKVENARTSGDVTRTWRLPAETPEAQTRMPSAQATSGGDRPAYFSAANWGKRSVALDLSQDGGREALSLLISGADIVLTAYKPGDAERLGIASLWRQRPGLIVAELTGYGPDNARAGYDAVVQAESGFMYLNGPPDASGALQTPEAGPTKMPVALMDLLAAHQIKEAVLAALFRRERTGEGAHIQISLLAAATSALANQGTAWLQSGHEPRRMGSAHPQIAPYGTLYPTRDGPIVLAIGTDRQFSHLCDILGLPLATDPRFENNPARVQHRTDLDEPLAKATAMWERKALLAALHEKSVPAGAVRRVSEALEAPEAAGVVLRDGSLAGLRQAAFTISNGSSGEAETRTTAPRDSLRPPPPYAAHTSAVLAELGATPEALARWQASGAIVDRAA